jgi:hypothetical protein
MWPRWKHDLVLADQRSEVQILFPRPISFRIRYSQDQEMLSEPLARDQGFDPLDRALNLLDFSSQRSREEQQGCRTRVYILLNREANRVASHFPSRFKQGSLWHGLKSMQAPPNVRPRPKHLLYVGQYFCIARRSRAVSLSSSALLQNINGAPNEALKHRDLFSR